MECPKCHNSMLKTASADLDVRKCQGCGGLLLREGSFEVARTHPNAAELDSPIGELESGDIKQIDCPECARPMMHMIDRTQHHIEFEACPHCDNVYLDAGELKDLTEFTLFERIKQSLLTAKTNLAKRP